MSMKKSAGIVSGVLLLLGTGSQVFADHGYVGSQHGYTVHETHTTVVTRSYDNDPYESHYDRHHRHHRRHHHHPHWKRQNSGHGYSQPAPRHYYEERVTYQAPAPQPYYQPAPQYSPQGYNGNVVSETLIGGALGAAAGAAIGAAVGSPGDGAKIGAVVGGFGGISRGILGRGLLW